MIHGKRICVVLPAYNAEKTLRQTVEEIPRDYIDDLVLVDDASSDDTAALARALGIHTIVHPCNLGYGGNQKTCYREALARGADIVIMLHPDYQYTPKLLVAMGSLIAAGQYDVVLGSRILSEGALKGGMPFYKYVSNRFLTLVQNLLLRKKLSEYHTGYRAFSREVLESLPLERNSDDFIFDNQMLAQAIWCGYRIGEISCPTKYFPEASSINLRRSIVYGLGVLAVSVQFRLGRLGLWRAKIFGGLPG
ncbi:MAG: glycosyltransferase family 2 protein [Deltaproteobacteria bacterium]|nr:MAG: glycosyltransferase family 2 protein [Deltaproteobacteria bacterium]